MYGFIFLSFVNDPVLDLELPTKHHWFKPYNSGDYLFVILCSPNGGPSFVQVWMAFEIETRIVEQQQTEACLASHSGSI